MSYLITYDEAVVRFGHLVTTDITIDDAIQEAVDRIFEMGRWGGTTFEKKIVVGDFSDGENPYEHYLNLNPQEFSGVIGFRNQNGGFGIQDQTSLFRIGVNSGDRAFIDYGLVDFNGVEVRRYRAPLNWNTDRDLWALLKKQAPLFRDLPGDTIVPVHSTGALKFAILAVAYETVNDEDRANANWAKFNALMVQGDKEFQGNKTYSMGVDSSLRRRPRQFN
jgi:hypothetical protein